MTSYIPLRISWNLNFVLALSLFELANDGLGDVDLEAIPFERSSKLLRLAGGQRHLCDIMSGEYRHTFSH